MTRQLRTSAPLRHICWAYDDPTAFDAWARDLLVEGLAAGERVLYSSAERPETVVERWAEVPGFTEALDRGAAWVAPVATTYCDDVAVIDPPAQVAHYAAATEKALADGFTGLRVIADATSLVRTPAQRDAFARYEHLIDRYMTARPMSAICAYDRRQLGDQAVAELACMHPQSNADVLFHLYGCDPADGVAALAGELDTSNHELFSTALDRADLRPVDGHLVVEATHLRFIDYRALTHLQEYAARRGATAVLRTPLSAAGRLVEMLGLSRVQVEAPR